MLDAALACSVSDSRRILMRFRGSNEISAVRDRCYVNVKRACYWK